MQCLDLQYLELSAPISVDAQGNFDVTVNNCWFMQASSLDTGCITSWLVEVAPMTAVPSGGVSSVDAAVGEGGQSASPITDFDPGCTMSAPSQGCSFLWVSGTSAFTDSGYGLSSLIEQALHLSQYAPESGGTAPASFPVPGGTAQNYIVRAYSGGFADLTEYGNILQGYYNSDSGALVLNAFAMNALQASVSYAGALFPSDSASAKTALASCVIQDAINNDDFSKEVTVLSTAVASGQLTKAEMQTLYENTVNTFVGIDGKYETTCAATLAIDSVKTTYSNLSLEAHLFLNDPKSALGGLLDGAIQTAVNEAGGSEISGLGEGTQRVVEMIRSATPIETAIVSVTTLNQSPQVTGILPNPVLATSSLQPVTIQGVGFQPGAEINWLNVVTGVSATTIPASVTPTSITASMNFTSQAANWKVQVVDNPANPSTTSSNWWSFPVTASSGSKPDLIPLGVTLSSGSVAAGNTVTVSFTVENQGTGSAAASTTGFRLGQSSSVPPGPSGDIPNSSISTQALTAGQSVQQSQTLAIPSATTAGTYYIWVVVDDVVNSTLGQSNTANDYASSPALTVSAGQTPVPTPTSPGTLTDTGFLVTTTTPTMQWSGSGATTYELAISRAPYGSGNVVYDNTTVAGSATSLPIPAGNLNSGLKYAWNMRATNTAGQSSWSAPLYFAVNTGSSGTPSNARISENLGFDLAFAPSESDMQIWLQDSPYRDIGVYVGGCNVTAVPKSGPNGCGTNPPSAGTKQTNTNLDSTWVSNVSSMGWGIMPLWVGPQASCISGNPSSFYLIDTSTSTSAYNEGVSEADSAAAAATALGMSNSIVYYDMEAYSTSNASCSTAVGQFLSGWVNEMHVDGFQAGVYGAPYNSGDWSNPPDAIWAFYPDGVNTASDLNSVLSGNWAERRIHQYCAGGSAQPCPSPAQQTWGGVTLGTSPNQGIDLDVEDGPVFSLTVIGSSPTVSGVSPSQVPASGSAQTLTINGSNFVSGATVTYHDPQGDTYAGHNTSLVSSSQLTDPAFNDASDGGTWTVTVVNPGGSSSSAFNFTVTASTSAPSVSSVSPNPVPASAAPRR